MYRLIELTWAGRAGWRPAGRKVAPFTYIGWPFFEKRILKVYDFIFYNKVIKIEKVKSLG